MVYLHISTALQFKISEERQFKNKEKHIYCCGFGNIEGGQLNKGHGWSGSLHVGVTKDWIQLHDRSCDFSGKNQLKADVAKKIIFNPLKTKRRLLYLKEPVRTARQTLFISVIKTNYFMLYGGISRCLFWDNYKTNKCSAGRMSLLQWQTRWCTQPVGFKILKNPAMLLWRRTSGCMSDALWRQVCLL